MNVLVVEVVTPEGIKELWAVAAPLHRAIAIVRQYVPSDSAVYPTHRQPSADVIRGVGALKARKIEP